MDVEKKKVIKIVLIIVLIIILLLLWLLFMKGKSFSKYRKEINSNGITSVAKPVFIVEGANDILIDGIEDTVYDFNVKNYDNTNKSDVDLKYSIRIENNSQADLEFVLSSNGKSVNLNNNKTGVFTLSSSKKQNDQYELKIKYKNNPAITSDIDGNVQIKVEAEQVE